MSEQDLKQLWKSQPAGTVALSEQELWQRANKTQRGVLRRNLLEGLAALFVVGGFTRYLWLFPTPLMRAGSVLIILATLVVMQQMLKRASSRPMPWMNAGLSCKAFHRTELVRQRDALRSVWLWYVGPFVPGLVVFRWGVETELGIDAPFAQGLTANLLIAAVMLAIVVFNLLAAQRLQRQIDQLDRQSGETP